MLHLFLRIKQQHPGEILPFILRYELRWYAYRFVQTSLRCCPKWDSYQNTKNGTGTVVLHQFTYVGVYKNPVDNGVG